MRRLLIFTIVFWINLSGRALACGPYYPYGEDVRFNLLKSDCFRMDDYLPFYYTSELYYWYPDYWDTEENQETPEFVKYGQYMNLELWRKRCKNLPVWEDVYQAVYKSGKISVNKTDTNSFIRYLSVNGDEEAIKYLNFAKECELYNALWDDPWEKQENVRLPQREKLIRQAEKEIGSLKDEELKRRYAFLAMRLAFYSANPQKITDLYKSIFEKSHTKDILYYWSAYFYGITQDSNAQKNFILAQVFLHAPDKRTECMKNIDCKIPLEEVLGYASLPLEKSAIYLTYTIRNTAKTLDNLKKMYQYAPCMEGLDFLLIREVNKLEDWICTPYYTEFEPSLADGKSWWERWNSEEMTSVALHRRMQDDKRYARELLEFVSRVELNKVHDPSVWQVSKAYLLFMIGEYETSLNVINSKSIKGGNKELLAFAEKLKALILVSGQPDGQAVIPESVKPVLMKYQDDGKFLFAVGRELEYKNNTTDAALLYSKKSKEGGEWDNVHWRSKMRYCTLYADFYTDYFFYLDAQYTTEQVKTLIDRVKNNPGKDNFSKWECEKVRRGIDRLYDLLGTKYMRQNKLENALQAFRLVNDTLWHSDSYYYKEYLNANPFYTDFYAEHRATDADTVTYTKREIVEKMIDYLKKAEDPGNTNRDYYSFLLGNAYFNMTQYGNSWMMKRYYWTSNETPTLLEDEEEYFGCLKAKHYYLKAKVSARNRKFAALCLRMAARCEDYRLRRTLSNEEREYSDNEDALSKKLFNRNSYYKQIKSGYPDCYSDLTGRCESFKTYLRARMSVK